MPPADRLSELLRQRAIVHEQLARLDREIAAARNGDASPPAAPVADPTPAPDPVGTDAEAILESYRTEGKALTADVRKGCLLYAFGAFALLILGAVGFYFLKHR